MSNRYPEGRLAALNAQRFLIATVCSLICVGFLVSPLAAQEPPIKIAIVNLDVVIAESPAGKALQAKLTKFQEETQLDDHRLFAGQALDGVGGKDLGHKPASLRDDGHKANEKRAAA